MEKFESRRGNVGVKDEVIYRFVSDIRNFERFIPVNSVKNWQSSRESCSFEIPFAGKTGFAISGKNPYAEVNYTGKGFQDMEFSFKIQIVKADENNVFVKLTGEAALNPLLKMMVTKPLEQFLERTISEIEKFDNWEDITV